MEIRVSWGSGLHGYQHTLITLYGNNGSFERFRLLKHQSNVFIDTLSMNRRLPGIGIM
jgi:hypothetical protein